MQPPPGKQPAVQAPDCCVVGAALKNACCVHVCMRLTRGALWHAACQPPTQLAFQEPLQTTGLVGLQLTALALGMRVFPGNPLFSAGRKAGVCPGLQEVHQGVGGSRTHLLNHFVRPK